MSKSSSPVLEIVDDVLSSNLTLHHRPRFRNAANVFLYGNRFAERKSELPSNTVPDQTLSMRDLLNRHNSGGKVKTFHTVYTGDDTSIPEGLERMSKLERAQMAMDLRDFVATTRGQIVSKREARKRAEADALIEKRVSEALANRVSVVADEASGK